MAPLETGVGEAEGERVYESCITIGRNWAEGDLCRMHL